MKDRRPVHLDLTKISLPVAAAASILHRVSGIVSFAAIALLLYMLGETLRSEQSFHQLSETMRAAPIKLLLWVALSALGYHALAGVRHLFMDLGYGESLTGGRATARITIALALALAAVIGWGLW